MSCELGVSLTPSAGKLGDPRPPFLGTVVTQGARWSHGSRLCHRPSKAEQDARWPGFLTHRNPAGLLSAPLLDKATFHGLTTTDVYSPTPAVYQVAAPCPCSLCLHMLAHT